MFTNTTKRYQAFIKHLRKEPAQRKTELVYNTPFQLLVAVILSAQCTDKRVNLCTPALFSLFPTASLLSKASFDAVFDCIKSISYPRNKTNFLIETAKRLVTTFNETIPSSVEALQTLPGVGRKTAHVIASILYNKPTLAVDTHVFRVAKRIGLAPQSATTPLMVEKELMAHLPIKYIQSANQWILLHGRYICIARKPKCNACPITDFCDYFQNNPYAVQTRITKTEWRTAKE
ncbi:endonuclease III [Cardinium endosymbiont of Culicoides punctatus]|uniref:endonuclease III n=1 Tax=Cardinium endosymbiont of Culicoides punctatus TaxID=2304601 RepID=UPI0010586D02|nr:endonuclease III [Cardinium endosymbiont of Culicoides punctatus]TDG93366.1 Endonuclease III [Cardinium endosymbiont of Culicoides punctatus]